MLLVIVLILSHALFIGGCYLLAAGIHTVIKGRAHAKEVLTSPLCWGLFMIMGGIMNDFLTVGAARLETGIILRRDGLQSRDLHCCLARAIGWKDAPT